MILTKHLNLSSGMSLSLCANMLFMTSKSMGTDRSLKSLIPLHCSQGVSVFFLDKRSWQEATKWRGKHWFKRQYFKLHPGVRGRALTLMTLILLGNSCWLVSRRFISWPRAPKERPCPRLEDSALLSGLHVWLNWHQWKVSLNKFESLR